MTGNRRQMYSILETDTQRVQETMDQEIQVEIKPAVKGPRFGFRHVFAFLGFLGFLNVYAMRVNMSVAIVAMVNNTDDNGQNQNNITGSCPAPVKPANTTDQETNGEFNWDETTQSLILGCFFYGYVLSQIPGGRAAEKYGGKWIFGIGILVTSIFTILMPFAAKFDVSQGYEHPYFLVATRIIEGLGEGVTFPVMHAMLAHWSPPLERSKLSTFIYAGSMIGTVVSLPLTGLICDYWGWEAAFYSFGSLGLIWFVLWTALVYDTPAKHPFISKEEKEMIEISLGKKKIPKKETRSDSLSSSVISELDGSRIDEEPILPVLDQEDFKPPIPYKAIFTSVPFWAIMICHSAQNWGFYTLLSELPTYMSKILHFDIKENAFISALPYLCMWIFAIIGSHLADFIRSKHYLTTTNTRKLFNSLAFIIPAFCLLMINYAGCNKPLVIALLCATVGINGLQFSSVSVNHIDIASNFAGTLMGFTNTVANTMGFLAPQIIGKIIDGHEDRDHWQTVFFIAAAVYGVGNLLYCLMASGEEQPWNRIKSDDNETSEEIRQSESSGPIMPSSAEDLIRDIYNE